MIIKASRRFIGSDLGLHSLSGAELKDASEEILGSVTWVSGTEGFCVCPGQYLHGSPNAKKDCKLYISPVPTLYCLHASCHVVVEETTKELRSLARSAAGGDGRKKRRLTDEEKEQLARVRAKEFLRRQTSSSRPRLLKAYPWPYADICRDSPDEVSEDPSGHWRPVLELFDEGETIWCGALLQSGDEEHAERFKLKSEWLALDAVPGHYICPSTFKSESYSRSKDNIVRRAFLVVESDELDKDTIGAVFRWLRDKVGMNLRCIVDTAGKSLHGWFDFPPPEELEDLRVILPELGCDPKMFTATQPCRLPGALRGGRHQKLIYLSKEEARHE